MNFKISFTHIFQIICRISTLRSDCDISAGTTFFLLRFLYQTAKKLNIYFERVKNFQCMSYRFGSIPNTYSLDFPHFSHLLAPFYNAKRCWWLWGVNSPILLSKPFGYAKIRVQNSFPEYVGVVFIIHHWFEGRPGAPWHPFRNYQSHFSKQHRKHQTYDRYDHQTSHRVRELYNLAYKEKITQFYWKIQKLWPFSLWDKIQCCNFAHA